MRRELRGFTRISAIWVGALVILVLALAIYLATQAVPLNDDFERATDARVTGAFAYAAREYHAWFGRWAAMIFDDLALSTDDLFGNYAWLLAIPMVVQIMGARSFIWLLLGDQPKRIAWPASLALVGLLWSSNPQLGEFYYWLCGAAEYSLGVSLIPMVVATAAMAASRSGPARWALIVTATALAFAVSGFHELAGFSLSLILAAGLWIERKLPSRVGWAAIVLGAASGLVFTLSAPGNRARQVTENAHFSLRGAVKPIAMSLVDRILLWPQDVAVLAAATMVVLWLGSRPRRPERIEQLRWLAPVLTAAIVAGWVFAPALFGLLLQSRGHSAAHCLFVAGLLVSAAAWAPRIAAKLEPINADRMLPAAAAVFGIALVVTGQFPRQVLQLKIVREWRLIQLSRHSLATEAARAGKLSLSLPSVSQIPLAFAGTDIGEDPTHWRNMGFARFHGLESVMVAGSCEKKPAKDKP